MTAGRSIDVEGLRVTVEGRGPVAVLLRGWDCCFGYEYTARYVDRVARVVGVDVGDSNSGAYLKGLVAWEKLLIAGYQLWLALAWKLGAWWPSLADRLTRFMARQVGCRTDSAAIGWLDHAREAA